jgi:hypothetical protein
MVNALMTNMMIDSQLITLSSSSVSFLESLCVFQPLLHAIAETHIGNRQNEECDRDCYPKNVFHKILQSLFRVLLPRTFFTPPTTKPSQPLRCSDLSSKHLARQTRVMADWETFGATYKT